ncbi:methylmalonyl Co-A mutase-associated GTPase MeaB [Nocardioides terrisoli]|uniref:methylmalonyl Co-A mutase-associated GTPase MeaB n=1 Tax=Nocardioides terrisoli TaxID=3388267 RepID=UPI00287BA8A0|nr:methylmalonyl Co-A mutase-associated GTPase MeaB [Nocardioides marmorisolisilvae]
MAEPEVGALVDGVRRGDRAAISRAITLVESGRDDHRVAARKLLSALTAAADAPLAVRVGISGVPGVGKSTFIESLGTDLTAAGHRVGVLAVDPSSVRTGGSVLGDKTRMSRLSADPNAYIRPSPSAGTLGGVARATAQAMVVLEAGGYDVVLVETVGVGQSEVTVAGMVDTFCFLTLARTGDQLQGIKKGILELADVIAVNKADPSTGSGQRPSTGSGQRPSTGSGQRPSEGQGVDRAQEARMAARELSGAIRMVHGSDDWLPPVLTCSGLTGTGVDEVWAKVLAHRDHLGDEGLRRKRAEQQLDFTWALVREELDQRLRRSPRVRAIRDQVRAELLAGDLVAPVAADRILEAYDGRSDDHDGGPAQERER